MDQGMYETPDMSPDELGLMKDALAGPVRLRDILLAKGYDVTYRATGTDHEWLHVRATFGEALIALLGRNGAR